MPARQRLAVLIMAIVLLAALFTASPPMPGPGEVAAGPMPAPPRQTVGTPVSAAPNDVSDTAPRPPAPPRSCAPNILYTNVYTGDLGTSVTTQTGRGVRDGTASACSPPEAFPGALTGTGTLRYQSYPVVNTSTSPTCFTVSLTQTRVATLRCSASCTWARSTRRT